MLDLVNYRESDFPIVIMQRKSNDPFETWNRIAFVGAAILAIAPTIGMTVSELMYTFEVSTAMIFLEKLFSALIKKIQKIQLESLTPEFLNCLTKKASFHLICLPSKFIPHETEDEFEKLDVKIENDYSLNLSIETIWEDVFFDGRKTIESHESFSKCKKNLQLVPIDKRKSLCANWQKNVEDYIRFQIIKSCLNHLKPLFILIKDSAPTSKPFCLLFPPKEHELTTDELVLYYRSSLVHKIKDFPV